MKTQEKYEVMVGNIGSVHTGKVKANAERVYRSYVELSKSGKGRASGESVTMFMDGEPIAEHHAGEVTRKVRPSMEALAYGCVENGPLEGETDEEYRWRINRYFREAVRTHISEDKTDLQAVIRCTLAAINFADEDCDAPTQEAGELTRKLMLVVNQHIERKVVRKKENTMNTHSEAYMKELIEANLPYGKTAEERPAAVAAVMAALVGNGTKEYARLCRLAMEEAKLHNDPAPEDSTFDSAADGWEDAAETADPSPTASPSEEPCYGCNAPGPHEGKATADLTGCDDLPDGDLPTSIKTFCNECLGK